VWGLAPVALTRMTDDLPGMSAEEIRERMAPVNVAPAVLYMVSSLSKDRTGQFLFAGGGRVAEVKVVMPPGYQKKDDPYISAQEIADHESEIFLPDEGPSVMG
jgi:hypothetical protein